MYLKLMYLISGCLAIYSTTGKTAEEYTPPPSLKAQQPLRPPASVGVGLPKLKALPPPHQIVTCNTQGHCSPTLQNHEPQAVSGTIVDRETGKPVICTPQGCSPPKIQSEETKQPLPHYKLPAVSGTVVDAETGKPIHGAVVHLSWVLHPMALS